MRRPHLGRLLALASIAAVAGGLRDDCGRQTRVCIRRPVQAWADCRRPTAPPDCAPDAKDPPGK